MNFTDEQIEEAARILCEMRGKRPDDVTDFSTVRINECFVPEKDGLTTIDERFFTA